MLFQASPSGHCSAPCVLSLHGAGLSPIIGAFALCFCFFPQFLWGFQFPTHMLSLSAPADLHPMQPRHGHTFCFGGICCLLVPGPSCSSCLSQRRGSVCTHQFEHLLSPGLLPFPQQELEGVTLAKAHCHALNGGDGKKCLAVTAASFSSSLHSLVDLNGHCIPLPWEIAVSGTLMRP